MKILKVKHADFHLTVTVREPLNDYYVQAKAKHATENFVTQYTFADASKVHHFFLWDPKENIELDGLPDLPFHPVFFEQVRYGFKIDFLSDITQPRVYSRDKLTGEAFEKLVTDIEGLSLGQLSGSIMFCDPGGVDLELHYVRGTVPYATSFHFSVFSTKLDGKRDLPLMVKEIEASYPLLAMDYIRSTYSVFRSAEGNYQHLTWWMTFDNLYHRIINAFRMIVASPYTKLSSDKRFKKADQIKKIDRSLYNKLQRYEGEPNKYFEVDEMVLLEDNDENRIVKYILGDVLKKYEHIYKLIQHQRLDRRMTTEYKNQLGFAYKALQALYAKPFFKAIGEKEPRSRLSPVLKTMAGYAELIACWRQLNGGYSLFDGLYHLELKPISYLYQLWCFLGLAEMIRSLGAKQLNVLRMPEIPADTFVIVPSKDMNAKLEFLFDDMIVELYHELLYNKTANDSSSITVTGDVRPDIVLRIRKRDQPEDIYLTYIFDAKYKLRHKKENGTDIPLQEDIDQMLRYREAIYYEEQDSEDKDLSKEIMGAYVLYPGRGDMKQLESNYQQMIERVNIGGFAFLPQAEENNSILKRHLEKLLQTAGTTLLKKVHRQKGKFYQPDDVYVLITLVNDEEELKAMSLLQTIRYIAPYVEDTGITYYYEVNSWKKRDLQTPLQVTASIPCYTLLAYLNSPIDGFVKVISLPHEL
jgi:uncharacterized protein